MPSIQMTPEQQTRLGSLSPEEIHRLLAQNQQAVADLTKPAQPNPLAAPPGFDPQAMPAGFGIGFRRGQVIPPDAGPAMPAPAMPTQTNSGGGDWGGNALSAALQKGPATATPPQARSYATAIPDTPTGQPTIIGQRNDPPGQREMYELMKQISNRGIAGYADVFHGDRQGEAIRAAENAEQMKANAAAMASIPHFLSGQSQMLGAGAAMTGAQAEAQKLALMTNPGFLALQTEQKRLEQGLPPSTENELILRGGTYGNVMNSVPGTATPTPPAVNPQAGSPPPKGGALSNALMTTQDRLAQLPSGRQVINIGDKARANGGFPAFMRDVQGELGDQFIDQNFPLLEQYANERLPGGLADFVNPSRLGQFGQGIGSTILGIGGKAGFNTYRPDVPLLELLHRGSSPEDVLRAKLRDKLQRMGKWNANTGAFSPPPYQP